MEEKDTKIVTIRGFSAKAWDEIRVLAVQKHVTIADVIEALLDHYKKTKGE